MIEREFLNKINIATRLMLTQTLTTRTVFFVYIRKQNSKEQAKII